MTAKQYLKQAYRLDDLIKSNQEELQMLREQATTIGAVDYSKDRVQTSPKYEGAFVNIALKISELEKCIEADIDKLFNLKIEIRTAINSVTDVDEKLLLRHRYLNFMTWEQICDEMHLSVRSIHRIHQKALDNFKVPVLI